MKIQKFNRLVDRLNRHQVKIVDFKPLEDKSIKVRLYDNIDGEFTDFSVIYKQDEAYSYELMVIDESGITSVERKDLSDDMHQAFIEALIDEALYNFRILDSDEEVLAKEESKINALSPRLDRLLKELPNHEDKIQCGVFVFTELYKELNERAANKKVSGLPLQQIATESPINFLYQGLIIENNPKLDAAGMLIESNDVIVHFYFKQKERIAEFLL